MNLRLVVASSILLAPAGAALAQPSADPAADLQSILLSLAVVVGLIVAGAFVLKRTPLGYAARGNGPLKIVASLALGPKERLLLVDVHGAEMLVAIGPSGTAIVPADGRAATGSDATSQSPRRAEELERVFTLGDAG